MLLSSNPSDTVFPGVLEENGMSPNKLVFRVVVGVGPTGDRNPKSPPVLSRFGDGPTSRNSVSFRFKGNKIGVLKLESGSTSGVSDVAGAVGGFLEEVVGLVVEGESRSKGRLFWEKEEWFVSSCGLGFSVVRKLQEERPDGHWIWRDEVS